MTTLRARHIPHAHADFIHDLSYDYYGKRLASCSSDQTVKVWDLDAKGEWQVREGGELKNAHQGIIWKLAWAHPEFGQVIASCSADRSVKIWEEQTGMPMDGKQGQSRWHPKATLAESRKQVRDIEFAPRHLGLKLAAASADGNVRVYEAHDVMNLNHWPAPEVIEVESGVAGVTALSWCKSQFDEPMLAVGTGSGRVQVWRYVDGTKWQLACDLQSHTAMVCDVDWAPNMGRGYHLIATAGREGSLRIHRLKRVQGGRVEVDLQDKASHVELSNKSGAWTVQWNITGTVLASSGDKSAVDLWKCDFKVGVLLVLLVLLVLPG
ncbi:unnamed protein product [Chrysoparadoxa australica]